MKYQALRTTFPHQDVAMLAFFTSLGTTASIIQQFHTIIDWNDIKLAQFANQQANADDPELAITGGSLGLDLVLFYIQFYCYNVEALLVLFWCVKLSSCCLPCSSS